MELGGKGKITHKLAGVKSSFPGFASFSSPTKTSACSDWHRQQNSICQLETRAWGSCHRCFQCKTGFSTGLPIPSLLYDQKVPQENSARSVTLCPDHTSVEKQSLVSSHSISVGRATIASSKMAGSSETSRHKKDTSPVPS